VSEVPVRTTDKVAASTVAAPRPHAQRGGRRAAPATSDDVTRPAAGRRARQVASSAEVEPAVTPAPAVKVEPVAEPRMDAVAVAEPRTIADADAEPRTVADADAEPRTIADAADATAEVAPAVEVEVEVAPEELVSAGAAEASVPVTAPVVTQVEQAKRSAAPKAVSRRTLRSASAAAALPAALESGALPVEPAPASGTHARPAGSTSTGASPSRSGSTGRRSRRGDIAKGTFSVIAMLFATGIAVATTMPATALHAATEASSMLDVETAGDLSSGDDVQPGQELTTASDLAASSVTRDGYGVRDVAALRAAGYRIANTFTNNPNSDIQWPFPVGVPISDGFGPRASPGGIGSTDHKGVDFTPGEGTPIQSVADGVVSLVQRSDGGGLGVYVMVDHVIDGQKVTSVYGHMLPGSTTVEVGQVVTVAQTIGRVGNTGTSTGAHLHLEIRVDGITPVDPYAWLQSHVS
jgi:murein DD-endopeptidase MepM/ murein hydrolase activator NlpD